MIKVQVGVQVGTVLDLNFQEIQVKNRSYLNSGNRGDARKANRLQTRRERNLDG
ncbi:MAG: hypothetical protein PHT79_12155 [Syntrophomonadaceae bacterium]|nr:hypothetical protein [Syntrophomonadaceae bacterium]